MNQLGFTVLLLAIGLVLLAVLVLWEREVL
jgi:hypothetical protein